MAIHIALATPPAFLTFLLEILEEGNSCYYSSNISYGNNPELTQFDNFQRQQSCTCDSIEQVLTTPPIFLPRFY